MTSIQDVQDFLALQRIAMVGVSRRAQDFSRSLFREMCARGYDMVPVNPAAIEIEGKECFNNLQVVKAPVEGALIMTPSFETVRVVQDCIEAGIGKVWIYRAGGQGALSPEAIALCQRHNIQVVEGHCPYMFFPATGFLHRAHGFLMKLGRRYPAKAA
ncbi:MAG TPA: CoA-binding protein [Terriglobales bacterium]|nr:CoA-binding protein [Terriglobales bacterium]